MATNCGRVVPGLTLQLTPEKDVAIFTLVDRVALLDVSKAVDIGLQSLARGPYRIVLDFSRATELWDVGLGFMTFYQSVIRGKGGRLVVIPPRTEAGGAKLLALPRVFETCQTIEEAMAAVRTDR